ncbi:hypothetical protein DENIT_140011 [Pseudomonas veronii]|nr:hypothetical protein DENIT_140011 [Pseudomonas veronii]
MIYPGYWLYSLATLEKFTAETNVTRCRVQLKYTSTGRQSAHHLRVRLGPLSALSDA